MSIVITGGPTTEALEYNRVHMNALTITQVCTDNDTATPMYQLNLKYQLYAVDSGNVRKYEARTRDINIEDYMKLATIKALEGSNELLIALKSVETAIGSVIETLGDVGSVA